MGHRQVRLDLSLCERTSQAGTTGPTRSTIDFKLVRPYQRIWLIVIALASVGLGGSGNVDHGSVNRPDQSERDWQIARFPSSPLFKWGDSFKPQCAGIPKGVDISNGPASYW